LRDPSFTAPAPGLGRDARLEEALTVPVESAVVALDSTSHIRVPRHGGIGPTGLPRKQQTSVLRVVESTV
jgi:hypothetical protein